jgi:hypothetical protein
MILNNSRKVASDLLFGERKQEVEQMKKLLLIALVVGGITFAAAPRTEAGTYFSVGIGFPIGFGYYGGCYPGYYGGYYPYTGYYRPYYGYYRPYYGVGYHRYYSHRAYRRPYYWHNGHRVYYNRYARYR